MEEKITHSNQVQCQLVRDLEAVQLKRRLCEAQNSESNENNELKSSQIYNCLCNFGTNNRMEFKHHYYIECPLPPQKVHSFPHLCKFNEYVYAINTKINKENSEIVNKILNKAILQSLTIINSPQIYNCLCDFRTNNRMEFKHHYYLECPLPPQKVHSFPHWCKFNEYEYAMKKEEI